MSKGQSDNTNNATKKVDYTAVTYRRRTTVSWSNYGHPTGIMPTKNDMKKCRLSAELNWIKRLQTHCPFGLNDQTYQQGNISSIWTNINVFSLQPDVRRKGRSQVVSHNGLSRRKQRLNRSVDDVLRIANNNGQNELLHDYSGI